MGLRIMVSPYHGTSSNCHPLSSLWLQYGSSWNCLMILWCTIFHFLHWPSHKATHGRSMSYPHARLLWNSSKKFTSLVVPHVVQTSFLESSPSFNQTVFGTSAWFTQIWATLLSSYWVRSCRALIPLIKRLVHSDLSHPPPSFLPFGSGLCLTFGAHFKNLIDLF
jgi:hypothetical protein